MPRVCHFTGKRTTFGKQITHRGKAKYLGGVGTKVTGITARKFKPNIQKVRAVINGRIVRRNGRDTVDPQVRQTIRHHCLPSFVAA